MKPLPPPRHPPADPEPLNPWDAVNALKVEIAAANSGAAPRSDLEAKLAAAIAEAEKTL